MAEFYFFGNAVGTQMLGCAVVTKNNILLIDGGHLAKEEYLQIENFLMEKRGKLHVDAWFFTHLHSDHVGVFMNMLDNTSVQVDKIYHGFPPFEMLKAYGERGESSVVLAKRLTSLIEGEFKETSHFMEKGEVYTFDDVKITVLRTFNPALITDNYENDTSVVFKVEGEKSSVLILGDLGWEGGKELMQVCSQEELEADYTQMAHHGQNGVTKECYEYIKPKRCLWSAPDWLWDNNSGGGYNSGPWKTLEVRAWMEELGVKEHYVIKDGTTKFEI